MKIIVYSCHPQHDYLKLLLKELDKITAIKLVRFRELVKLLLLDNNFIIHLQFPIKQLEFLAILLLAKIKKIKIIWTPHDLKPLSKNKSYFLLNYFLKLVDKIIVLSRYNQQELINNNNIEKDKIEIMPLGNFNFYNQYQIPKNMARNKLKINKDKIVFLQFGPYRYYKGYHLSAGAFQALPHDLKNKAEIIFAGKIWNQDKPLNINLKSINTTYLGNKYLSQEEIGIVFSVADVVLYPYLWITQSGSLFLSLAFGKACIASNIGGIPEIITNNKEGLLINPDVAELKEAMIKFIEKPQLIKEYGNNSLKKSKKYSWPEIAQKHLKLYKKL